MSFIKIVEHHAMVSIDADAILVLLDAETGKDRSGTIANWPDIGQLIEMMALKRELMPTKLFWIEVQSKYVICIVRGIENGEPASLDELIRVIDSLEIKSINMPNDTSLIGLLMQYQEVLDKKDIVFSACGARI